MMTRTLPAATDNARFPASALAEITGTSAGIPGSRWGHAGPNAACTDATHPRSSLEAE